MSGQISWLNMVMVAGLIVLLSVGAALALMML
jgi:hypothetical protein